MAGGTQVEQVAAESDAGTAAPPSSWVAEFRWRLAALDPSSLSERERVELVAALERLKGTATATQARAVHFVVGLAGSQPAEGCRALGGLGGGVGAA